MRAKSSFWRRKSKRVSDHTPTKAGRPTTPTPSPPPSPLHFPLRYEETPPTLMATSRWVRPEVYPLFAAMGVAAGICGMQLYRNITGNPEVRVNKVGRAAGVLENYEEGRRYAEHGLRHYVRNKTPEIMPAINKFFTEPK